MQSERPFGTTGSPWGLAVGDYLRRVEKLGVLQMADGAVVAVGIEYHHTKRLLV